MGGPGFTAWASSMMLASRPLTLPPGGGAHDHARLPTDVVAQDEHVHVVSGEEATCRR